MPGNCIHFRNGLLSAWFRLNMRMLNNWPMSWPLFFRPQGNIAAYSPTNTLIIKDQTSVVKNLIKVIKGKPYLSECQNFQDAPATNQQNPPGWMYRKYGIGRGWSQKEGWIRDLVRLLLWEWRISVLNLSPYRKNVNLKHQLNKLQITIINNPPASSILSRL